MQKWLIKKNTFSLVELLVVIAIMAMLGSLHSPALNRKLSFAKTTSFPEPKFFSS